MSRFTIYFERCLNNTLRYFNRYRFFSGTFSLNVYENMDNRICSSTLECTLSDLIRAAFCIGYPIFTELPEEIKELLNISQIPRIRFWGLIRSMISLTYISKNNNAWTLHHSFYHLDRGEKTIVSQTLGLVFTYISCEKAFNISHLIYIHLLRPDLQDTGNIRRIPDFIGINSTGNFYVIDSKGRSGRNCPIIERNEKDQVQNIQVNGLNIEGRFLSVCCLHPRQIRHFFIDPPPKEKIEIPFNEYSYILHYLPIISLLDSSKKRMTEREVFIGNLKGIELLNGKIFIGLEKTLYEMLNLKHISQKIIPFEEIKPHLQNMQNIKNKFYKKKIKELEKISLGLDGMVVIIE